MGSDEPFRFVTEQKAAPSAVNHMTSHDLAVASMTRADGLHPKLVRVIQTAILKDPCFVLGEGARSDADQLRDWQRHVSRLNGIAVGHVVNGVAGTGRGNHQKSLIDGWGHAADLPPIIG